MGARSIILAALSLAAARGFQAPRGASTRTLLRAATVEAAPAATGAERLAAERYVVQNRFKVKKGREAAFEKRWADRESRLGNLDGFRFFCMLRRVDDADAADDVNYVSATVWETKANFDAWKKGDAFKEAHGGGTVAGVAGMLVATLQNTKGKPKVAAWEGLLPLGLPGAPPADGEGWRRVAADGEATLPSDVFVAMNRFPVAEGSEDEFERRFADRSSTLADFAGFKGFLLLRRDDKVDDGATHSTFSVWDSRASFQAWLDSEKKPDEQPRKNLLAGRPTPSYYEGILALESAQGV
ncbi:Antibiotic biosynthesis monooxygenase [Aureococcus anophagefferens]|uniref:Antibiotic biosynthesis monooxygenase n=1 Tax=Aureococcus anophagefferens TaxID=44056 RepID=A0ABR1G5C7_AURAN